MNELEKLNEMSSVITDTLAEKIIKWVMELYDSYLELVPKECSREEINKMFMSKLDRSLCVQEMVGLNVRNSKIIKNLAKDNEELADKYAFSLETEIISKVYRNIKDNLERKPSLKDKIKEKQAIIDNMRKENVSKINRSNIL